LEQVFAEALIRNIGLIQFSLEEGGIFEYRIGVLDVLHGFTLFYRRIILLPLYSALGKRIITLLIDLRQKAGRVVIGGRVIIVVIHVSDHVLVIDYWLYKQVTLTSTITLRM